MLIHLVFGVWMIKGDSTERRRKKVLETSAHSPGTWGMIKGEGGGGYLHSPPKKGKVLGTWALIKVSWVEGVYLGPD